MQTALITGASSGLGFSLCRQLLAKKYIVVAASRSLGKAEKFLSNKNFIFIPCDISSSEDISNLLIKISNLKIDVNLLINNASKFSMSPLLDMTEEEAISIVNTNVLGTINLTTEIIKTNLDNLKYIMNILSVSGLKGQPNQAVYSASKHALKGFFESLSQEYLDKLKIINFYPGGINTELWDDQPVNKKLKSEFMTVDDVANFVLNQLSLPKSIFVKEIVFFPKNDWH